MDNGAALSTDLPGRPEGSGGKRFAVFHPTPGFNFAALQAAPAAGRGAPKGLAPTQERGSRRNGSYFSAISALEPEQCGAEQQEQAECATQ